MPNKTLFKLKMLDTFLKVSADVRKNLLKECIEQGGTNSTILMRRFRMLSQLSQFEAEIISKIYKFDDNDNDLVLNLYKNIDNLKKEIGMIVSRNS